DIDGTDSLTELKRGPYLRLDVVDSGVGFESKVKERAFDPFFSTKDAGRGLGLASVLGIVRRHGGGIEARSNEDGGTTMRVWLPRSDASPATTQYQQDSTASVTADNNGTVLIIDDEETVRNFLESALKVKGYTVLTASTGSEGIEIFVSQAQAVSLVLLDFNMPGMTGLQTFRKLRERDTALPVILMSGFTPDQLEHERDFESLAGFLQKPFRLDELYRRVQGTVRS
ncbi:MAG: response regulator, partial [Gammaproteobacteria bacterium]